MRACWRALCGSVVSDITLQFWKHGFLSFRFSKVQWTSTTLYPPSLSFSTAWMCREQKRCHRYPCPSLFPIPISLPFSFGFGKVGEKTSEGVPNFQARKWDPLSKSLSLSFCPLSLSLSLSPSPLSPFFYLVHFTRARFATSLKFCVRRFLFSVKVSLASASV